MSDTWLKFEFQLPEDLVLELTGKHFSCSEFPGNILVFGLCYTLMGNDWCTGYRALSYSLKCYAWSPNLRFLLKHTYSLFSPIFMQYWIKNQCLSPTFGICWKEVLLKMTLTIDLGLVKLINFFSFHTFKNQ